jgi:hypothetical protein
MLQTFEQATFLKIKKLLYCEHNSCRGVLSDFLAMRRNIIKNQGSVYLICMAAHFVINGRRVFVGSFNRTYFDE